MLKILRFALVALVCGAAPVFAETAEWIWHESGGAQPGENEVRYFRRTFTVVGKVLKAELQAACDDQMTLFLNGKEVGKSSSWNEPLTADVTKELRAGENVLAVQGRNETSAAGLVLVLQMEQEYGKRQTIMTDRSWVTNAEARAGWNNVGFDANGWLAAKPLTKLGAAPWGDVFKAQPAGATRAEELVVLPGFKVELLKSATSREGSWVSLAVDDKGRLYISPQNKAPDGGIMRLTLDARGQVERADWLKADVGAAMGMLWAFDSLYVSGQGPDGQAIYRLRDTNGDDELDELKLFKKVPGGGGEHGAHALVLGPDRKSIFIAHGNSTPPVEGISEDSPYRGYQEDALLPRLLDPVATFFDKLKIPYGQIYRTDENGTKWQLIAGGFRNHYDIDFNADGELFTYDSDMEWDVGLPWYRPTRILHITSGADFGFREGSTKWPAEYPESLGAVVNVGLGSPTGVKFGTRSNFPGKYRRALFAMDWTYGRILAVHMREKGAGYVAQNPLPSPYYLTAANSSPDVEPFVSGKGLPVTDLEFGKDGAMYFIVGGRGTQAGLYRVSYVGPPDSAPASPGDPLAAEARAKRRKLEALHGRAQVSAIDEIWDHLGDADRTIRYAARVALESQPVEKWQARALGEAEPGAGLTALLALARYGGSDSQMPLLDALRKFPLESLDDEWKLNKLRVIELSLIRHGRPSESQVSLALEKLGRQFPAATFPLNRELSQILVWLGAADVVEKTLALMERSPEPAEQIWYAYVLREAKSWTRPQREKYFAWFGKAREYKGGNSFPKFIARVKENAVARLSGAEKTELAAMLEERPEPSKPTATSGPERQFQKAWTVADLAPELSRAGSGRNFARGKEIFASTLCVKCHHFGPDGGNVGPDLTAVASRFNRRDLLESVIEPSKALSEQYASFIITTKTGETEIGQIVEENGEQLVLITDLIAGTRKTIAKAKIAGRQLSPVSLMPPGLLNVLTADEILDLLAYLESGGSEKAPAFK